jgi:hypothetical protein
VAFDDRRKGRRFPWHRGLDAEVIEEEQLDADEFSDLLVVAGVESGGLEALVSLSARSKCTLILRRQAMWPRAVARKVLPTPTAPRGPWPPGAVGRAPHAHLDPGPLLRRRPGGR